MEKQRRTAFDLDVTFMKDHHYWHNYMINQSAARKEESERRNKYSSWPRNEVYKPRTPRNSNGAIRQKRTAATEHSSNGYPRQPQMRAPSLKSTKYDHDDDDDDNDDDCIIVEQQAPPRRVSTAKVTRRRRSSTPEESPIARKSRNRNIRATKMFESDSETEDEPEMVVVAATKPPPESNKVTPLEYASSNPSPSIRLTPPSSQQVKIIFSETEPELNLLIPKSSLKHCNFLFQRCNFSINHGCGIIPLEQDLQAKALELTSKEMAHILPYFHLNSIGPEFLSSNKNKDRPFGNIGTSLKQTHANTLGTAFITASKISHHPLQQHILTKLKALYPLPELSLLTLVLFLNGLPPPKTDAEVALGGWIIDHLVESHSRLVKNHSDALERILGDNEDLKEAVMGKLAEQIKEEKGGLQDEIVPARAERNGVK